MAIEDREGFLRGTPPAGSALGALVVESSTSSTTEITNDAGNPIPVSKDTTTNSATNPLAVRQSDGSAYVTPSQEHVTAASPHSNRLSDGTAFYDATKTGQLPTALVGGRLDVNVGAALPAGTNNIGDVDVLSLPAATVAGAASLPAGTNNIGDVDVLSLPAGTVAGGASLPAGTNNIGDVDVLTMPSLPAGTNNIGDVDVLTLPVATVAGATAKTADFDSGAGTDTVSMQGVAVAASGGAVAITGDATNGLDVDVTRVSGNVTVVEGAPAAANILAGRQTFSATTAATTLITIPAGRTWIGTIGASVDCAIAAASATAGQAAATFTTAGAGVTPAAGTYFVVEARAGANAATGTVGSQDSNFGSMPFTVVAPGGNSVTIQVASTNAGTDSLVEAFASGRLV